MKLRTLRIHWLYEGEPGYWVSAEGRFSVSPVGYRHTINPDGYQLRDEMQPHPTNPHGKRVYSFDTVAECKAQALAIALEGARFSVPE